MASQVKGITITFRGDTTSLDKAIRKVKTDSKSVDAELKRVNNALKFNPKNTELLSQKQGLLKQKVDQTRKSLADLKDIQSQMDADGVDKNSAEYQKLRREIIETESKLKNFNAQLAKVTAQNSKLYKMGEAFKTAGSKIEGAGRKLAPFSKAAGGVVVALGAITYKAGTAADDINTLSKQTGISTKDLQLYAASADLVDVSVEAMAKSHQTLKKNMFSASEGKSQKKYFDELGISVTDSNGNLRDANEVYDEAIAALGKMTNETQRDALAMKLFGKSASDLNPLIEDGGETYKKVSEIMSKYGLEPVSQEQIDKANEFNDQIDAIKLVFTQAVTIIGTKLAGYLVPIMTKVTDVAGKIAEKIAGLSGGKLAKLGGLSAAFAALSPVLIVVGKAVSLFGSKMQKIAETAAKLGTKFPKLAKVLRLVTNPIALIVAAFAGLGLAIGKSGKSADDLVKAFGGMVSKVGKKLGELIPKVVEILKKVVATIIKNIPVMLKGLGTLLEAVLKAIIKYAPTLLQGAVTLFTKLVEGVTEVLPKVLGAIIKLVKAVLDKLPTFIPLLLKAAVTMFSAIVSAVPEVVTALVNALPKIATAALNFFKGLLKSIEDVFAGIGKWFLDKFKAVWTNIKTGITGDGWGKYFGEKLKAIKDKFTSIPTWFSDKFKAAWSAIKTAITGDGWGTYFKGKLDAIKNKFQNIGEWFGKRFGEAWSAIKDKFSGWSDFWSRLWFIIKSRFKKIGTNISMSIKGAIASVINKLMTNLESKLNHVIVTVNRIIKFVNDHSPLDVGYLDAVQLPRLAKGGIVDSATVAMIGEGRSSEAVIPLDELWKRLDKMTESLTGAGGGSPIVVNVYGAEGQSTTSIAEAVRRVLIEEEKRRRLAWR